MCVAFQGLLKKKKGTRPDQPTDRTNAAIPQWSFVANDSSDPIFSFFPLSLLLVP